ncbi:hypothetical protein BGZ58_010219 [Dissophora ornata]|nr:hypothetical protein BGZ58_010219 [Dissophora ornata]
MPFIQPMGVSANSRSSNSGIDFSGSEQKKTEVEQSYQVKNNWVKSADDTNHIFTKTWLPVGTAAQSVVVVSKSNHSTSPDLERLAHGMTHEATQEVGDMIYQGNKMLMKRWKKFPTPLPILLLHGTEDPICSYQSTAILSAKILKLEPINFVFKSWKGNKHDPHWDLDAASVKSEYIHWICNTSRHFSKLPLEPSMVHSDSIKSVRAKEKSHSIKGDITKTGKVRDKKDKKAKMDERLQQQQRKDKSQEIQASAAVNSSTASTVETGTDSTEKGKAKASELQEPIHDLMDLLRQQQQKLEKAKEKRREYGLEEDGKEAGEELQQREEISPAAATASTNGGNVDGNGVAPPTESVPAGASPVANADVMGGDQKDAEQKVEDIENGGTEDTTTRNSTGPTAEKADPNLDAPSTEPNVETALPEASAEINADSIPTIAIDASLPIPITAASALTNETLSESEPLEETKGLDADTKSIAFEIESSADASSMKGEGAVVVATPKADETVPKFTAEVKPSEALLNVEDEISEASGSTTPQKVLQEVETPRIVEHTSINLEEVERIAPA